MRKLGKEVDEETFEQNLFESSPGLFDWEGRHVVDAIVVDEEEVSVRLQDRPDVKAFILMLVANEACCR